MTNTITVDQLKELLQIQKDFDSRLPTLNLEDSKAAYVVKFFKWFDALGTLQTFENLNINRDKAFEVQLNELSDMLVFGLSIANQCEFDDYDIESFFESWKLEDFISPDYLTNTKMIYDMMEEFCDEITSIRGLIIVFKIAEQLYSIDQLITAYKVKMMKMERKKDIWKEY
uniref:dUTPase n=1 Tax=Staphylococcus shinii TaxID=2912228 RepID=UPI003F577C2A